MNEDLLKSVMAGIDPARDLTDETLDSLVPHEQLMSKITAGIGSSAPALRAARVPVWRRMPALVGASAAALTLAIAGAVTLFSSAPLVIQGTALGPSKSAQTTVSHEKVTTGTGVTLTGTGVVVPFILHNRWVIARQLDAGVFTVVPAPASMKTPPDASGFMRRIWATSQLQGYSMRPRMSFGFGLVTITKHVAGVPVVTKVPAWVGLAYETAQYHCPLQTGGQSTQELLRQAPSSGMAAVVVGQSSGSPAEVYIAKSVRCGRLYPAELANALEQFSLPWSIIGKVGTSKVAIEVSPPPCGSIVGNAVAGTWRSGFLSSITITEYGTAPEYTAEFQACPVAASVKEVIDLRGPTLSNTHFFHPTAGPMTVVANATK